MEICQQKSITLKCKEKKEWKTTTTKQNPQNIQDTWDKYSRCNILVVEIPEGKEREKGAEEKFKTIMAENCPKLIPLIITNVPH